MVATVYEERARVFKALCDERRQKILALLQGGDEAAEDVASAEVYPDGMLLGGGSHGSVVKSGQLDAQLLPLRLLVDNRRRIHLHNDLLLYVLLLYGVVRYHPRWL